MIRYKTKPKSMDTLVKSIITMLITSLTVLCIGCKSHRYYHPVEIIYTDQSILNDSAVADSETAIALGKVYMMFYEKSRPIKEEDCDSIDATLVNKNDIWKVRFFAHDLQGDQKRPANGFVYIRKKDGALLYTRVERGEWIGETDLEDGPYLHFDGKRAVRITHQ
jgi:hypothetical protein